MGIWVRVKEYTGKPVAELSGPIDIGGLCRFAASDPQRYPLLSGVDEYDDTYFNRRQAARLMIELEAIAAVVDDSGLSTASAEIGRLARLLEPSPGRPGHRLLIFSGD
jgi:hypothetical protein